MGVPYTPEQLKKLGYIMVNGVMVKASSQVAKGKVEKIEVDFTNKTATPYFDGKRLKNQMAQLKFNDLNLPAETPEQIMKAYKETGIIYAKPIIGDTFLLPAGGYVDVKYRFVIDPISAPRMSQSDKWKTDPSHPDPKKRQRQPVANYFRFKNRLVSLCEVSGYKLTKTLNIIFVVPFPKSYSAKKKAELNGKPHDQKPDIDNYAKCWMDSLSDNDREVWNLHAIKVWGYEGQIIIF